MSIEDFTGDIFTDIMQHAQHNPSNLAVIALAVKTHQTPGESPRLRIIQLRTASKIYTFDVGPEFIFSRI